MFAVIETESESEEEEIVTRKRTRQAVHASSITGRTIRLTVFD